MAHTNSTTNYDLPQWIGSDKPTFLGDFNSAFNTIDTQMKSNADTAAGAAETASSANATAISANETAVTADGKATLAKNTADAATAAAQSASDLATVAKNTADSAARTAQANNIANLAPAYDETRTYAVGDLVSYIDDNNTGKLYKCIVAWNTPGAFNVNYWDDVTASALFEQGYMLKSDITLDTTKSYQANFHDNVYPALLAVLPQEDTPEAAINKIKDSDVLMVVWNPNNNRFERYMLSIYSAYTMAGEHSNIVFTRVGQEFPEYSGNRSQRFNSLSFGEKLNDNAFEAVILKHADITDPGDSSVVTENLTPTIRSLTYAMPPENFHVLIYQRSTQ